MLVMMRSLSIILALTFLLLSSVVIYGPGVYGAPIIFLPGQVDTDLLEERAFRRLERADEMQNRDGYNTDNGVAALRRFDSSTTRTFCAEDLSVLAPGLSLDVGSKGHTRSVNALCSKRLLSCRALLIRPFRCVD